MMNRFLPVVCLLSKRLLYLVYMSVLPSQICCCLYQGVYKCTQLMYLCCTLPLQPFTLCSALYITVKEENYFVKAVSGTVTLLACRWPPTATPNRCCYFCKPVSGSSRTGATGVKPLGLPLKNRCAWFSGVWHHWHWIDTINVHAIGWLLLRSPTLCLLTILAPVVVFHRLHDERKVGPELPFPRRIRYSQLVDIILSYVHSELKLQRGRKLFYH